MPVSVEQLGKAIVAAGVMSADELKSVWSALPTAGRPKNGEALAGLLVKQGKLTDFQSQELLSGSATPLVLGDYVLPAKIGAGGMGQVFKAQHRHMKRLVAIKLLPAATTKDEAAVKRFQREVEAAARLSHPNIVAALDARNERGIWCLVMEYVEGRDLAAVVKQRGPLPVRDAVDYILQAARGLAYAHAQGIVHRDIKPANLMLCSVASETGGAAGASGSRLSSLDSRLIKILDMGLARIDAAAETADPQLTNSGVVMGTVDFMAPEQAANTHKADARSDIYSLGCSLYQMLAGKCLFGGQTLVEKILAHRNDAVPSLCQKRPDVPAEIDRIFQKMVAKQPTDRYQQTTDLVADLEAYMHPNMATSSRSALQELDGNLAEFLGTLSPHAPGGRGAGSERAAATKTPTKTAAAFEQTVARLSPEFDTDPKSEHVVPSLLAARGRKAGGGRPKRGSKPPMKLIAGGIGGLALLLLLGIWVIVRDKDGHEVARVPVPEGGSATVAPLSPGGRGAGGGGATASPVKPQAAKLTPVGPPPPAVAPFDAKAARAHQQAWAKHLGMQVETRNSVGQTMVLIPPGEFLMGSTDEQVEAALKAAEEIKAEIKEEMKSNPSLANYISVHEDVMNLIKTSERPQHKVVFTKPFLMSATEVTIGQFTKFSATGYLTEAEKAEAAAKAAPPVEAGQPRKPIGTYLNPGYDASDEMPAGCITWNDAVAYCKWLSTQEKITYRLPTEAEWEYACRAGTTTQYSFGDDYHELPKYGWYLKGGIPFQVAWLLPNHFGLFDMHGNVLEWCGDYFETGWYQKSPPDDPACPSIGGSRVIRGGDVYYTASECRSASRFRRPPSYKFGINGFRCVAELNVPVRASSTSSIKPPPTAVPPAIKPVGPPPPPVAPFDAKQARAHQQAWAKHLGMKVETRNSVGQTMVLIPPGEFLMGSTDEQVEAELQAAEEEMKSDQVPMNEINRIKRIMSRIKTSERPQHKVVITKPFWMSATEVTIGQFKKFSANGYQTEQEKTEIAAKAAPPVKPGQPPPTPIRTFLNPAFSVTDDFPASWISWNDAVAYCKWLSDQEGRTYRLPTEAEWEYACRAGTTTQFNFGDDQHELLKNGWHNKNSGHKLHPVGALLANHFGLFDMHGNLYEWCGDFYDRTWYEKLSPTDPIGPPAGFDRVLRGGSWYSYAVSCRSAYRSNLPPSRSSDAGFRCVSSLDAPVQGK